MFDLLGNPTALLRFLVALLIPVTIHEFAHAYVADRLGDPTPRAQGRLTLNPLAHLDPLGSLVFLVSGFGWAKPVQINPANFADWRRGTLVVAAAGPLANVTLALILGAPYKVGLLDISTPDLFTTIVLLMIRINAVLAIFNLIPVPPLDGSKILVGVLPPAQAIAYARLQPFGLVILLLLVATPISRLLLTAPIEWLILQAIGRIV